MTTQNEVTRGPRGKATVKMPAIRGVPIVLSRETVARIDAHRPPARATRAKPERK